MCVLRVGVGWLGPGRRPFVRKFEPADCQNSANSHLEKNISADSQTANSSLGKNIVQPRLSLGRLAPPLLTHVLTPLLILVCLVLSLQSPQRKALKRLPLEGANPLLLGESPPEARMPTRNLSLLRALRRHLNPRAESLEAKKEPARHSEQPESHSLMQMILQMIHLSNHPRL